MKIARIDIKTYDVPLASPVVTATGCFERRRGALLRAHDDQARIGWGEAAPWPGFGSSGEGFEAGLEGVAGLEGELVSSTEDISSLAGRFESPEVACAVDGALLDLFAQREGLSLSACLSGGAADVAVHALVNDAGEAAQAREAGFTAVKVKVGALSIEADDARIEGIRQALGEGVSLRLDANGAWGVEMARVAVARFARHGLEFVEQPVAATDIDGLAIVCRASEVPVAADEAVTGFESLERVLGAGVRVVVLKPMFVGGILKARSLAMAALRGGAQVVVTHALEGAVGRLGALHLAASIPGVLACGLAGTPPSGMGRMPEVVSGRMNVPSQAGLGLVNGEGAAWA